MTWCAATRLWNRSPARSWPGWPRPALRQAQEPIPLILDQTKASDRHQILMLSVRWGERALPLAWRVEETEGAIGFATQQELLAVVAGGLPADLRVVLLADRFYGTPAMIRWCHDRGWDYRLRLKGNLLARWAQQKPRPAASLWPAATISKLSPSPASGSRPTSASFAIPDMPSPGSSPCRPSRDI